MKFLTDAMLGKLTRFLRIFGYDTIYANDLIDFYCANPVPDKNLKEYALLRNRIVITKDLPFYNDTKENAILLEGKGIYNYLNQLKRFLNLDYDFNIEKARCSVCNSMLKRISDKNSIKEYVNTRLLRIMTNFSNATIRLARKYSGMGHI